MTSATLIVNTSYMPIAYCSSHRAICLVVSEKAEIVEEDWSKPFRSQKLTLPYPKVIRLLSYIPLPNYFKKNISKKIIMARDNYTCQYCGRHQRDLKAKESMTIDHILPVSKKGKTIYENTVACCNTCNERKDNRTPREAGMRLLRRPREPRYISLILVNQADDVQRKYFVGHG